MSVQLFTSLLMRSATIQQKIEDEQRRRWPDGLKLLKLKKLRLAIKDRLLRLVQEGRARPHFQGNDLTLRPASIRSTKSNFNGD
jgi:uncharacterized protein YdcH (DUF465 family)